MKCWDWKEISLLLLKQKVCFVFCLCEYVRCGVTHVCQASSKRETNITLRGGRHVSIYLFLLVYWFSLKRKSLASNHPLWIISEIRWIEACSQSPRCLKWERPLSDQSNKFNQTSVSRSLSTLIHPVDSHVNAFFWYLT